MASSSIVDLLRATLDPNPNNRIAAELNITQFLAQPEAGLPLAQLVITQEADISLRQHSASIILRKYVKERWSPYFSSFKGSPPSAEVKGQLRQAIFQGLSDPNRKIRSLCALTLSSIANCDWPDEYPDLLTSLINLLSSNSPASVHGSMQVFTEFIKSDLTEDQTLPVLRDLLPVLLSILGATEVQTPLTRSRAVSVFQQCVMSLFMVKEQHPQSVKEATATVLPVWLEAFKTLLSIDPAQDVTGTDNWDGLAVRIQIFKTLDTIYTSFSRAMTTYLSDFLNAALIHLDVLYPTFARYYLNSNDSVPQSSEDEPIELTQLVSVILDFTATVCRGGRAREWFNPQASHALISSIFKYTQMTDDDEEIWANNANAFVAQEDDETQSYSVRVAGFDFLGCIVDRAQVQTISIFNVIIQEVIASSKKRRDTGDSDWWRALESALASIGSQADYIDECIEEEHDAGNPKPIDIESLLTNVIPSTLTLTACPFLQGRGFVFASQFAKLLPVQLAGQYLEAAVQVVEAPEASIPVKISAVKAVHNFCTGTDDKALNPFMARIAKDLGPFLLHTSEDTLSLVLETVAVIVDVDEGKWLTTDLASALVSAILEVWHKNSRDPIFLSIFPDILKSLAKSPTPGIYERVVNDALPSLCHAIGNVLKDDSFMAGSAIDLVTSLVDGSPTSGLGDGFFALLAPNLFKCLEETDDRDVIQNGIICLTLVVRKDCAQLSAWSDASGQTGLEHTLRLVAKLLQGDDESAGLTIGELIIHLLRRVGESILPVLPELLGAMVNRMLAAKTASFIQSLVIPFAFLINNQRDTVLDLLESININGRSGLDIVIQTWCENAGTFQGFWPSRTSTMGLSQLFISDRASLQALAVKGDVIIRPETKNVIMTRSRTKSTPVEFTSIRFPVKALKILIHDIQSGGESAAIPNIPDVDADDEDWDDDEGTSFKEDEFEYLSELIGPRGMAFDNDDILEVSDDEDLRDDPISRMNMQEYLVTFLRECATRNTNSFSSLVEQLSAQETMVVHKIVSTS